MSKKPDSKNIPFSAYKDYLKSGSTDSDAALGDVPLYLAHALGLRRSARLDAEAGNTQRANQSRGFSREVLKSGVTESIQLDPSFVQHILTSDTVDYEAVFAYLRANRVQSLPVLTGGENGNPAVSPELITRFRDAGFKLHLVPTDSNIFGTFMQNDELMKTVIRNGQIPEWYREYLEELRVSEDAEMVSIWQLIKERWFILFIAFLGLAAVGGFVFDVSIPLGETFALSIYGAIATTRAVWQIKRAERWNEHSRRTVRDHYTDEFEGLLRDPALGLSEDEIQEQIKKVRSIGKQPINWQFYLQNLGIGPEAKKKKKAFVTQLLKTSGAEVTSQQIETEIAQRIIKKEFGETPPTSAIIIPTYQTSAEQLDKLLGSVRAQEYPVTTAYVVYNDYHNDNPPAHKTSRDRDKQVEYAEYQQLVDKWNATPGANTCRFILTPQPAKGKREAMAKGFITAIGSRFLETLQRKFPTVPKEKLDEIVANLNISRLPSEGHEFIINVDSDTKLADPFTILNSMLLLKRHPNAGGVTGDVEVLNKDDNLLAMMTYLRYKLAFYRERAAQHGGKNKNGDPKGEVTCFSGPLVVSRASAMEEIFVEWYFQEFLGERCTYGDDRNWSSLLLLHGMEVLFCTDSRVLTDCPTDFNVFLKQQFRWSKSFTRENILAIQKFLHKLDKYVQLDVVYQQGFAFVMLAILSRIGIRAAQITLESGALDGLKSIVPYTMAILFYNELFFGVYSSLSQRDPKFLLSPVYIAYHFRALIWLKLRAFFDLRNTDWGTKGKKGEKTQDIKEAFLTEAPRMMAEIEAEIMASQAGQAVVSGSPEAELGHETPEMDDLTKNLLDGDNTSEMDDLVNGMIGRNDNSELDDLMNHRIDEDDTDPGESQAGML